MGVMRDHERGADRFDLRQAIRASTDRLFPERQFLYRSQAKIRYLSLSQPAQVFIALVAITVLGWVAFASTFVYVEDRASYARGLKIAELERAYRDLAGDWKATQERFSEVARELEDNHRNLLNLLAQRAQLEERLNRTSSELARVTQQRDEAVNSSGSLQKRVGELEVALRSVANERLTVEDALSAARNRLASLTDKHKDAVRSQEHLKAKVASLETQLGRVKDAQRDLVDRVHEQASATFREIVTVIDATGIPFRELLLRASQEGLGGPFVPYTEVASLNAAETETEFDRSLAELEGNLNQWEQLQALLKRLPFAPPLDQYETRSGFGKRVDPFTGQWAMHDGVDISSRHRSTILAAGHGIVSYVGARGPYGRTIEIDHGLGIMTRYAHLRRTGVRVGDTVSPGAAIGEMGSSGRSTGAHLHYEVHFDGRPLNPELFLRAGKMTQLKKK